MEAVVKQASKINDKIMDLISQLEDMKLDSGVTPRTVRQWKKGKKDSYSHSIQARDKVAEVLKANRQQIDDDLERRTWEAKREREERVRRERQQQERELWKEKLKAELRATEQKPEMEAAAKTTHAKLPKLKITQFKGTSSDWVRFENMFSTQVDSQPISDEEKFGYLLKWSFPR